MQQERLHKFLLWTLALLVASVFLCFSDYKSTSNDSNYYSTLVVRYADKTLPEILTAKWGENFWSFDPNTFMRDQLPGQLLIGIALTKVGVPARHALHLAGMFFLLGGIFLIRAIISHFDKAKADYVFVGLFLCSLTFSYTIRANHEPAIFFFSTLALYSGLKIQQTKWAVLHAVLSPLFLMWVKGPFLIFGFFLFTLGFLLSGQQSKKYFLWFSTNAIAALLLLISGIAFEMKFKQLTGDSFFNVFWNIQMGERVHATEHFFLLQKYLNFQYYFLHYLGYALPWILFALYSAFWIKRERLVQFLKSDPSLVLGSAALVYLLVFSASNRIAGRYVFPGYYYFTAWIFLLMYERFKKAPGSMMTHYLAAALWITAVFLRLKT